MDGSGTRTWEIHDALGSVRQTLAADGSVVPGGSYAYTPFGVVAGGNTPAPFGFTGELHSEGLVYLRARWYDPSSGTFTARDPFAGFPTLPYSLHPYQYGYSNPLLYTDPSGRCVGGKLGTLDCTVIDFAKLSWSEREQWMINFAAENNLGGWFRNIEDIIAYFSESNILNTETGLGGGWASWADAGVLEVIQDGWVKFLNLGEPRLAEETRTVTRQLWRDATDAWIAFFEEYERDPKDFFLASSQLKTKWAVAEQAGVNYGVQVARDRLGNQQPTGLELELINAFIPAGDTYRGIAGVPYGGGLAGLLIGGVLGVAVVVTSGGSVIIIAGGGAAGGCVAGEWFTTPSSQVPGARGPTYYSAWTVEAWIAGTHTDPDMGIPVSP